MSHKRNEALRHVQHSMHHVIAAGEGSDRAPDSCKLCPYYRPDFKFRTCLYAHCPYKKQVNVFRSTPEKWDIMTSKSPMRSCDDVDEQALSYAEVKALCAGDPRIREKMDLDVQVAKLKVLRSDYQNQKYRLEDKLLKHYPEEIQKAKNRIAALKNDAQIADAHPQDKENFCGMTIKGMVFDEKKAAGERLMLACKEMPNADMMLLGTYRGFELNIRFDSFKNEHQIVLRGELSYPVPLGDDPRGNIVRLDNAIGNFADRIADADAALDSLEQQKQAAEVEIAKPFAQEEELQTKSARLAELDALLNMEHQSSRTEPEAEEKPDARPSVLAALEEKADKELYKLWKRLGLLTVTPGNVTWIRMVMPGDGAP